MKTSRTLLLALLLALATTACSSDATGPTYEDCNPTMGGGVGCP